MKPLKQSTKAHALYNACIPDAGNKWLTIFVPAQILAHLNSSLRASCLGSGKQLRYPGACVEGRRARLQQRV